MKSASWSIISEIIQTIAINLTLCVWSEGFDCVTASPSSRQWSGYPTLWTWTRTENDDWVEGLPLISVNLKLKQHALELRFVWIENWDLFFHWTFSLNYKMKPRHTDKLNKNSIPTVGRFWNLLSAMKWLCLTWRCKMIQHQASNPQCYECASCLHCLIKKRNAFLNTAKCL